MTPNDIVDKFAHSLNNFEPIDRKPSDSDLTRIREAFAPLLLQILYDETSAIQKLIGLIRLEAAYVAHYGAAFPKPEIVGAYNPLTNNNDTTVVCARTEAAQKAKRSDCATYDTARREMTQFVLTVVADTWVREAPRHRDHLHRRSPEGPPRSPPSGVHSPARPQPLSAA